MMIRNKLMTRTKDKDQGQGQTKLWFDPIELWYARNSGLSLIKSNNGWQPYMDDKLTWKTNLHGWRPYMDDNLTWMSTLHGWQPYMDDNLSWMTKLHGWQPYMDDSLKWRTAPHNVHQVEDVPCGRPTLKEKRLLRNLKSRRFYS